MQDKLNIESKSSKRNII